jgi:hypothetical protein
VHDIWTALDQLRSWGVNERERQRQLEQLHRRRSVIGLPMVALRHHAYLSPPSTDHCWRRQPRAVGIGVDDQAVALWDHHAANARLLTHHGAGADDHAAVILGGARPANFIQPLPDGQVLLVDARTRGTAESAEVWDAAGTWVRSGHCGDAVEHVLATPSGDFWIGYFDEAAASGRDLGGHGLVRFGPDMQPRWRYPFNTDLPCIDDCEALNLHGEDAYASVYKAHHLISVRGSHGVDHGKAPQGGAAALLVDGERAVLIGGYGADYDLATPISIDAQGVQVAGEQSRLVLPDGMEIRNARWTCRGPELHAIINGSWYRASLNDFHPAA